MSSIDRDIDSLKDKILKHISTNEKVTYDILYDKFVQWEEKKEGEMFSEGNEDEFLMALERLEGERIEQHYHITEKAKVQIEWKEFWDKMTFTFSEIYMTTVAVYDKMIDKKLKGMPESEFLSIMLEEIQYAEDIYNKKDCDDFYMVRACFNWRERIKNRLKENANK